MQARRIDGSTYEDSRGRLVFCNDLDLEPVVRFYRIQPADAIQVRGWQGHEQETKWFHCIHGGFTINTVGVENFSSIDTGIRPEVYTLKADKPEVLMVPGGMCTAFRALEENSEVLVLSDRSLEASAADDYRFPIDTWPFRDK